MYEGNIPPVGGGESNRSRVRIFLPLLFSEKKIPQNTQNEWLNHTSVII